MGVAGYGEEGRGEVLSLLLSFLPFFSFCGFSSIIGTEKGKEMGWDGMYCRLGCSVRFEYVT